MGITEKEQSGDELGRWLGVIAAHRLIRIVFFYKGKGEKKNSFE